MNRDGSDETEQKPSPSYNRSPSKHQTKNIHDLPQVVSLSCKPAMTKDWGMKFSCGSGSSPVDGMTVANFR